MNRFWESVMRPCLELIGARTIVEIGSDTGKGTVNLLEYCQHVEGRLISIDPVPKFEVEELMNQYKDIFELHEDLSLSRLPLIDEYDAILVDGDHNWYTVYNELKIIQKTFYLKPMPLIFLHDVSWPYGRRDLYYNPENIPLGYRQSYAQKGMKPNQSNLSEEGGINEKHFNAIYENNPNNGVLTAVEDFINESNNPDLSLQIIPIFYGLGIIASKTHHSSVVEFLSNFNKNYELLKEIELERVNRTISQNKLTKIKDDLTNKVNSMQENLTIKESNLEKITCENATLAQKLEEEVISNETLARKLEEEVSSNETLTQKLEEELYENYNLIQKLEENTLLELKLEEILEQNFKLTEKLGEKINENSYNSNNLKTINNENISLKKELDDLKKTAVEQNKRNKKLTFEIQEKNKQLKSLRKDIRTYEKKIHELRYEISIHLSSVRYRLGDTFIKGMKPSIDTIKLPIRMFRLFKEGKYNQKQRNSISTMTVPIEKRLESSDKKKTISTIIKSREVKVITVDVIVCVHNALEDVKECLISLQENNTFSYRIIIVDDGSQVETQSFLANYCAENKITLIRNEKAQGYTVAANQGLRESTADYVVLLNSDTIVTDSWIEKMVNLFKKHPKTGITSPLSNAASWQTVPDMKSGDDWKVNTLPDGMSVEFMNRVVELSSEEKYPVVSGLNGFCFMICRKVINSIGYLDEETFQTGYGEETDYCIRASRGGFELRVLDNTYIFHEKSKSFGHEQRLHLSKKASDKLKIKHGQDTLNDLVEVMKNNIYLERIRETVRENQLKYHQRFTVLKNKKIAFVLPSKGGGGGSNSVVQEVYGMIKLGFNVVILNEKQSEIEFNNNYPEIKEHVVYYNSKDDAVKLMSNFDIVCATAFMSTYLLELAIAKNSNIVPCYYVQDYEPYFFEIDQKNYKLAYDTYNLIQRNNLFAKTDWIRNEVNRFHNVNVAKVSPSMDIRYYNPFIIKSKPIGEKIIISAMVRFATPRRQPFETLKILKIIKEKYNDAVEIYIFGSDIEKLAIYEEFKDLSCINLGILKRWEVADLLRKSDFFLDYSTYQAFGRTGLECMALGCIPFLPEKGGVFEYAVDGVNSFILDTYNIEKSVAKICSAIENKYDLDKIIDKALITAQNYSINKAAWSELEFFVSLFEYKEKSHSNLLNLVNNDMKTQVSNNHTLSSVKVQCNSYQQFFYIFTPNNNMNSSTWIRVTNTIVNNERINNNSKIYINPSIDIIQNTDNTIGQYIIIQRFSLNLDVLDKINRKKETVKNLKVIYDIDDDILGIDRNHNQFEYYSNIKQQLLYTAKISDIITSTTQQILDSYEDTYAKKIIVPNYVDINIWAFNNNLNFYDDINIYYMGTFTHNTDLDILTNAFEILQKRSTRRIKIKLIGGSKKVPYFCEAIPIPADCTKYPDFVKWVQSISKGGIALAPLVTDSKLNQAKSYLIYLDYTMMNCVGIYSNIPAYAQVVTGENGTLLQDNNPESWADAIEYYLDNPDVIKQHLSNAKQDIMLNHLLQDHYQEISDIFTDSL